MPKPPPKPRNWILAAGQKDDPARYRTRTVQPKRGKGSKTRPRQSNRTARERGKD